MIIVVIFVFLILADPSNQQLQESQEHIRSEIEAIADAADHDGYASGIQALEQESSSSSSRDSSWTTTSNYPKNVEVVYESTPDEQQKLSYQESTYHELPSSAEETTYQDTPPQPIYQQKNEYSEDIPTATESSYYANIRAKEVNVKDRSDDDNELMQEIEALEQKLDILQDEIQTYLNLRAEITGFSLFFFR